VEVDEDVVVVEDGAVDMSATFVVDLGNESPSSSTTSSRSTSTCPLY